MRASREYRQDAYLDLSRKYVNILSEFCSQVLLGAEWSFAFAQTGYLKLRKVLLSSLH